MSLIELLIWTKESMPDSAEDWGYWREVGEWKKREVVIVRISLIGTYRVLIASVVANEEESEAELVSEECLLN